MRRLRASSCVSGSMPEAVIPEGAAALGMDGALPTASAIRLLLENRITNVQLESAKMIH